MPMGTDKESLTAIITISMQVYTLNVQLDFWWKTSVILAVNVLYLLKLAIAEH